MKPGDEVAELTYPHEAVEFYRVRRAGRKTAVVTGAGGGQFTVDQDLLVVVNEVTAPLLGKVRAAEKALVDAIEAVREAAKGA